MDGRYLISGKVGQKKTPLLTDGSGVQPIKTRTGTSGAGWAYVSSGG
jgi:hypothetical protein